MPELFDSHLIAYLNNPQTPCDTENRACMVVEFSPLIWKQGLLSSCSMVYAMNASVSKILVKSALYLCRQDMGLTAILASPAEALEQALVLSSLLKHHHDIPPATIALAQGEGIVLGNGDWRSIARFEARRLACLGGSDELLATDDFIRNLQAPEGVGMFRGKKPQIQQAGFEFWNIKDYRCQHQPLPKEDP